MAKTTILSNGDWLNMVFDATCEQTFRFSYNGHQVVKNQLVIRDNVTNAVVYDDTVASMRLEHVLPADTLTNGGVYNARITVTYRNGDGTEAQDVPSDAMLVNCYRLPLVQFDNLSGGTSIGNSSYTLQVHYSQEQGDLANKYIVRLFNSGKHEVWNSGMIYPAAAVSDMTFAVTIANLENSFQYYVSCEVEAVCGLWGSTGQIGFHVSYIRPRSYSTLYLDNVPQQYSIRIRSNIKVINGIVDGPEPTYLNNEMIDLSGGETTLSWTEQGSISGDFQLMLRVCSKDEIYKDILELSSDVNVVTVKIMQGLLYGQAIEKLYAVLYSDVGDARYMTLSNLMNVPTDGELYTINVIRQGKYWSVALWEEV